MKIQSLSYFVALVEAGSISKAARQLYLSQPSLTKTLHLLEEELGVALVSRSSSGIRLAPREGERINREAKQGHSAMASRHSGTKGTERSTGGNPH